jgi:hypothetical protein
MSLYKSSSPIIKHGTSHYQRVYAIDARNDKQMRISGIGDPEDWGSIDAGTYDISTQQEMSEEFKQLLSFTRYLVIGGTRHIFAFSGTDPIGVIDSDTGAYVLAPDWTDLGMLPGGVLSPQSMVNVGNDIAWLTVNGVRAATIQKTTNQLVETQIGSQLDKTLRVLLPAQTEDNLQAIGYQRRNWVLFKAGSEIYVYNWNRSGQDDKVYIAGQEVEQKQAPSWHKFEGRFADELCYLIREDGTLWSANYGWISKFDVPGCYADHGNSYTWTYRTPWLSLNDELQKSNVTKHGYYIKPLYTAVSGANLTMSVEAPYDAASTDSVTIEASANLGFIGTSDIGSSFYVGSNYVQADKLPLRWRGEVARFRFSSNDNDGPQVMSGFTVYYTEHGVE